MEEVFSKQIPRHGYINKLAKLCNCSRKTVTRALFDGHTGAKAEKVKEMYREKYADQQIEE